METVNIGLGLIRTMFGAKGCPEGPLSELIQLSDACKAAEEENTRKGLVDAQDGASAPCLLAEGNLGGIKYTSRSGRSHLTVLGESIDLHHNSWGISIHGVTATSPGVNLEDGWSGAGLPELGDLPAAGVVAHRALWEITHSGRAVNPETFPWKLAYKKAGEAIEDSCYAELPSLDTIQSINQSKWEARTAEMADSPHPAEIDPGLLSAFAG